jgi:hypothetical protein
MCDLISSPYLLKVVLIPLSMHVAEHFGWFQQYFLIIYRFPMLLAQGQREEYI